jgi:creatinine amidohydrolase
MKSPTPANPCFLFHASASVKLPVPETHLALSFLEFPPVLLAEMNWPAVAALPKSTPVVIPIAALEQHGHHMPVFTDSLLMGEVARRAEAELKEKVLFTPLMWLGNSEHHMDFAGTMTAAPRVYLDLLTNMIDNMLVHGFQRILLINGHGGNHVPGQQVVFELRQKHRQRKDLLLLSATLFKVFTADVVAYINRMLAWDGQSWSG